MLKWFGRCVWRDDAGNVVVMRNRAIRKLVRLARKFSPSECGSWLIGEYPDAKTCIIRDIADIPRDSVHGRFTFSRGIMGFELVADAFVGEWHTHPRGMSVPSGTDDETMDQLRRCRLRGCASPILMILSGEMGGADDIGVYVYCRDGKRVRLMRQQGK